MQFYCNPSPWRCRPILARQQPWRNSHRPGTTFPFPLGTNYPRFQYCSLSFFKLWSRMFDSLCDPAKFANFPEPPGRKQRQFGTKILFVFGQNSRFVIGQVRFVWPMLHGLMHSSAPDLFQLSNLIILQLRLCPPIQPAYATTSRTQSLGIATQRSKS